MLLGAPVVQQHVWHGAFKPEPHVQPVVFNFLFCPVLADGQLDVDVTFRVEGKGGGGVAVIAAPAGGTLAFVGVLPDAGQQRDTVGSMLAQMLLAAK